MIIDVHTRIWSNLDQLGRDMAGRVRTRASSRVSQLDASAAALERSMSCVDVSLVLAFRSEKLGAHVPNELVADFVRKDPQKRIGICCVDPMSGDALDQLERASALGLAGVVVSPACQGFHPSHSSAMRVYERCAAISMPLLVTMFDPVTAGAALEFARPALWDEVAQAFPKLPILLGQLGHPWIDETLLLLSKHSNMYADIAGVVSRPWQLYNALLSATSSGVMDKLLFGSGFPFDAPAKAIETLYSVNSYSHGTQLPAIPRALLRGIVERDALHCLGIESDVAVRRADEVVVDANEIVEFIEQGSDSNSVRGTRPRGTW
jgi:uncharacterized protein